MAGSALCKVKYRIRDKIDKVGRQIDQWMDGRMDGWIWMDRSSKVDKIDRYIR